MSNKLLLKYIKYLKHHVQNIARDCSGNVGIIFGLTAFAIIGVIGLAIDYGQILGIKAKLDLAADAASVAGITAAQNYVANYIGTGDPTTAAQTIGASAATAQFNANMGRLPNGSATPQVNVTLANGVVTSTVTTTYVLPTLFMGIFGMHTDRFTSSSTATANLATYVNIFVLIDNSQSMGIGATAADETIIYNASMNPSYVSQSQNPTKNHAQGCALTCHYSGVAGTYNGNLVEPQTDLTATVRSLSSPAVLRIDVAKSAISQALKQITTPNINMSVFTFSNNITQVYPASSFPWSCETTSVDTSTSPPTSTFTTTSTFLKPASAQSANNAISAIDLQSYIIYPSKHSNTSTPQNSYSDGNGGTNITNALQCLYNQLNQLKSPSGAPIRPGNGLTPTTPISYVILVTDGVQDSANEAQTGANAPVVDYPPFQDTQPPQTFAPLSNCSTDPNAINQSCQHLTGTDPITGYQFDTQDLYFEAIDPTVCTPIKALGYTIDTLEVQYIIPPLSIQGASGAARAFYPRIASITGASAYSATGSASVSTGAVSINMASCASSKTNAYSANAPADIRAAADAIFGSIKQVQAAHISK